MLKKTRKPPFIRRFLRMFSFFLLIIFCCFFIGKIKQNKEFPIRQVAVYGVKHLDQQAMQHQLEPLVKNGFFGVEVEQIKDCILQMPWVADVAVRRIWPDQVMITVAERDPAARWNHHSLLSYSGEIFRPTEDTYPANLPDFMGPEGEQIHMLQYYTRMNDLLKPLHTKVAQLELTPYLSWNMQFADGMKVNLGYKDVLTRVRHFVKVYPKIVGTRAADVEYIDLRYSNGLAVRWKTVL